MPIEVGQRFVPFLLNWQDLGAPLCVAVKLMVIAYSCPPGFHRIEVRLFSPTLYLKQ
jgi:hypothetical protein